MPKTKNLPVVSVLTPMGGTGKTTAAHMLDFMQRGQRAQAAVDAIIAGHQPKRGRPKLSQSKAGREIERRAYNRAADLAKGYAEHWEGKIAAERHFDGRSRDWSAKEKAGHWRIIEKEIRALADEPAT